MSKLITRNDAREEKIIADANREHALEVKQCRAKVTYWKGQVRKYGGSVQRETLARFEAKLAGLTA